MGISDANGAFDKVTCNVNTANDKDFTDATFDLVAETNSINTGLEARDNHLRSEDFFAVSQFPTISFKSSACKKLKGKKIPANRKFIYAWNNQGSDTYSNTQW